ncbi:RICIN domain-containing protein [Maribacter sp.]|nr:RICIN domain-containing protein [Maribacter sp.]
MNKKMEKKQDKIKDLEGFFGTVKSMFMLVLVSLFLSCCTNLKEDNMSEDELDDIELNSPVIQTPEPLIYLADNLDEQDKLGWCIDTQGIGFNETLHAHSCKPTGGDVQFYYNEETRQICSAEYADFCIEMTGGPVEGMTLSLINSDTDSPEQKFNYDIESGEFRPEADDTLCLAVGTTSVVAGSYMSRSLSLESVANTEESLKKWVIAGTGPNTN